MNLLKARIRRVICRFLIYLRKIKLPGFQGVGLYDVLRFFLVGLMDTKFTLMASAMAYQFFFSLLPTLLLVVIVLRQFPISGLEESVLEFILQFLPEGGIDSEEIGLAVKGLVRNYLKDSPSIGLIVVSILLALWGATRGIIAMMKAFTKKVDFFKKRPFWELYGMALVIFIVIGGIITMGVSLRIAAGYMIAYFHTDIGIMGDQWAGFLSGAIEIGLTIITLFAAISALYYLAPATTQRWKFISPGSITAGILALFAIVGLKYFFINFTNYDRLYGSLAAIIVLMVWFYYISYVLLIGFELNAAIDLASLERRRIRMPDEVDDKDKEKNKVKTEPAATPTPESA